MGMVRRKEARNQSAYTPGDAPDRHCPVATTSVGTSDGAYVALQEVAPHHASSKRLRVDSRGSFVFLL